MATIEQGITENEPNSVTVESTETESVAAVEHGITENEPNFVSTRNTKEIAKDNHQAKGLFREDRTPRSSPRKRCRRSRRGDRRRPLNTGRPTRAFGAGLRARAGYSAVPNIKEGSKLPAAYRPLPDD